MGEAAAERAMARKRPMPIALFLYRPINTLLLLIESCPAVLKSMQQMEKISNKHGKTPENPAATKAI
jgi:hypothetical protein